MHTRETQRPCNAWVLPEIIVAPTCCIGFDSQGCILLTRSSLAKIIGYFHCGICLFRFRCLFNQPYEFFLAFFFFFEFLAPEVLKQKPYGKAVDCWAVGVICYILWVWEHISLASEKSVSHWMKKKSLQKRFGFQWHARGSKVFRNRLRSFRTRFQSFSNCRRLLCKHVSSWILLNIDISLPQRLIIRLPSWVDMLFIYSR